MIQLQPVILSGGTGTRLWPLSREAYPKQFLPLAGELTMLQQTARRLDGFSLDLDRSGVQASVDAPVIVSNEEHRFLVAEQLRQLRVTPRSIVLEPFARNTAPALTLAALSVLKGESDPILLVMPADHLMLDPAAFRRAVVQGLRHAAEGRFVTFGIRPLEPATSYGYILRGKPVGEDGDEGFFIDRFVEKPDPVAAQRYLDSGDYLWNSGIFMLRASAWTRELERLQPDMARACALAYRRGQADLDFYRVDPEAFAACPGDSIDYAVMEHMTGDGAGAAGVVIPLSAGWSDVGAWSSLWEVSERDEQGNAVMGDVYLHRGTNNMVRAEHRLVAGIGIEDLIIAETADAVMVVHRRHAQDVRQVVDWLKSQRRSEYRNHLKVLRPWGSYESVVAGERFQVKRLTVNPGASLSLQLHHHRAEHWVVVKGTARVTCGEKTCLVTENESTYIPIGTQHRLENAGKIPLELIEVQSGAYLGEDDIVRFDDIYGRVEGPAAK